MAVQVSKTTLVCLEDLLPRVHTLTAVLKRYCQWKLFAPCLAPVDKATRSLMVLVHSVLISLATFTIYALARISHQWENSTNFRSNIQCSKWMPAT